MALAVDPYRSEQICLFCKMVAGEVLVQIVCEGDATLTFRDINPSARTSRYPARTHRLFLLTD